jgi:hypothetical protein
MVEHAQKSLADKLGIAPQSSILVLDVPQPYHELLGQMPDDVVIHEKGDGPFDMIHFFTKSREDLERYFPELKSRIKQNGMLWISWPKMSSGIISDINENIIMQIGLKNGLVDVKVVAIDETWSGLKFVYRVKERSKE